MLEYLMLIAGFLLLIKGAEYLINGASSLAKMLGVSELMIGLSVVAFGTSLPELLINVFAALENNASISLGNVIGSNIFNVLTILGILTLIGTLKVHKSTTWKEIPFALLATLVLAIFLNDVWLNGEADNMLSRAEGLVLLSFFFIFLYYLYELAMGQRNGDGSPQGGQTEVFSAWKTAGFLLIGLIGLFIGGRLTVDGAVIAARNMGISEFLISSTIIAMGTGLPELVASIMAALKKNMDMAVGNIVGSNIFNIFFVLGVTATINPVPFDDFANFDVLFLIGATVLLFLSIFTFKPHRIDKPEGILFLILYAIYAGFIILRG
ncbi:MAG: calcium/sodium antiporter [Candidatus Micrarchaeota archaeon]